ncbi:hypothetical protein Leryth_016871 [Lithospermum erythrorhizon]|nr:hypothetical protein Leryth_016871 [Lithospermum erythrorhizon]
MASLKNRMIIILLILLIFITNIAMISSISSGFVQTRGTRFLLNKSPFLFNGFNSYWMMHIAANPNERYKVSNVFRDAVAAGLTVCRTWAFSDGGGGEALQISPGVYNEQVFQKVLSRMNTITGVAYKDEPTIMAWELINEPRCVVDYSGKTIHAWVQEMAGYTKSIDRNHLLSVGMEGFYGDSIPKRKQFNPGYQEYGTDFISNHLIKEIDFATIHSYADAWLPSENNEAQMIFVQRWIMSHTIDTKKILKKPLVFSEFGKSIKEHGYNISTRDAFMNSIYTSIYGVARKGALAGGLVWQILAEEMESYDDGYGIVLSQSPSTRGIISLQSHQMNDLQKKMGRTHDFIFNN